MAKPIPRVLLTYIEGLKTHDIQKIESTVSEDLRFISATRILDKQQALKMLTALYSGFPDWNYAYDGIEDRGQGNYAIKWRQGGTHTGDMGHAGNGSDPAHGQEGQYPRALLLLPRLRREAYGHLPRTYSRWSAEGNSGTGRCSASAPVRQIWPGGCPIIPAPD